MRIRCPACSATYEVADALLDPPRTVRCARCANDWVPEPAAEAAPPEAPAEAPVPLAGIEVPVHEPAAREPVAPVAAEPVPMFGDTPLSAIERLSAPTDLAPRLRRRDRILTVAWAASFAILAALAVAGYTQRERLMQEWPASKQVYARLGLAPADAKSGDAKSPDPATPH
jgi:predicted Zn finger-like uncharacterized protein